MTKHKINILILVLLACSYSVSYASNQIQPEELIQLEGFSIRSPDSKGWFVLNKSSKEILFDKPTEKGIYHTVRAFVSTIRNEIFLSTNDLKSYVKSDLERTKLKSKRHKNVAAIISIERLQGVECVSSNFTVEDHNVPDAPGEIFLLVGRDYFCPHPDFPESYVISLSYSQRFLKGEKKLPYDLERKSFINSLVFSQLKQYPLIQAVKTDDIATVGSLIANGFDVNLTGSPYDWGKTALIEASIRGNIEIIRFLINNGADVNTKDNYGDTALMFAAEFGHTEVVKFLLKSGADVNATLPDLTTALMIAARKGEYDIVKILLDANAEVNIGLGSGDTALSLAAWKGNLIIMKALVEHGADVNQRYAEGHTLLCKSIGYSYGKAITKLLITSGADVNARCKNLTPLISAANLGNTTLVQALLDHGAEVNIKCKSKNKITKDSTALHWAALRGHVDTVKILLEAKPDLESKTKSGDTALVLASINGHAKTVDALLRAGADGNTRNNDGMTPLHISANNGHDGLVKLLLANDVNIDLRNKDRLTALELARRNGHFEIIKLLEEATTE